MTQAISLIVGLGNPGKTYAETRHNAGFRFLHMLKQQDDTRLKSESRFHGDLGQIHIEKQLVWLLAPMTYMNHSGQSVSAVARYYKISVQQILVVHDELDLPPGSVRLKIGGGCGGHNGLKDIADHMDSRDFLRLRIGIGHPGSSHKVEGYVLKKAPKAEQALIDNALTQAQLHLQDIMLGHYDKVMNELHSHR